MAMHFLIVDDSQHFLDSARTLLEGEGSLVSAASTTEEALRQVRDTQPDVVLVDVYLGSESGIELARRIESETDLDPSRVILVSTYAEEDLADLIDGAPVAAFLTKSRMSGRAIREMLGDSDDPVNP
jgi:CheY-like chemotaxis protein